MSTPRQGRHSRYPGPHPFADNAVHHQLFFGRREETEALTQRVRASKVLVLFGASGLGKTSLLQAGLCPSLRPYDYLPVFVRFDQPDATPEASIISAILASARAEGAYVAGPPQSGLRAFFSEVDIWLAGRLLTPILIFDQFEEVFTVQKEAFRTQLEEALRQISALPLAATSTRAPAMDHPLRPHVVISMREEYLGMLEGLAPSLPAILDNRFRLAPLTWESALQAIEGPALADGEAFSTAPYRYADATLDAIRRCVYNRKEALETFHLQVICQQAEAIAWSAHAKAPATPVMLDERLLPEARISEALARFYANALRCVSDTHQRRRARALCERQLIAAGERQSLRQDAIEAQFGLNSATLATLTAQRLIRRDRKPTLEGYYHEISQDSLIEPILNARRARRRLHTRRLVGAAAWVLAILLLGSNVNNVKHETFVAYTRLSYVFGKEPALPDFVKLPRRAMAYGDRLPFENAWVRPLEMARTEITFEEYQGFWANTGRRPPDDADWGRGDRPVIQVSWDDATAYADWLGEQKEKYCRLPTEAEWEYAARAGTDSSYALPSPGGSDRIASRDLANCDGCGSEWDRLRSAPVASFQANAWGLYDMHGNVWEWAEDCVDKQEPGDLTAYKLVSRDPLADSATLKERGGRQCGMRVVRGGSWSSPPTGVASEFRVLLKPTERLDTVGFRVVCTQQPPNIASSGPGRTG